ncbi:protein-tyrosine phosphatase family protein [Mycolicibacterium sp. XJ870]
MTSNEHPAAGTPWPHDDVLHAWWVQPRRLLAGEYPGATTPEKAAAKLRLLAEAGVDTVIDLTTEQDGLTPYDDQLRVAADEAGRTVRRYAHPIPDYGVLDHAGYDAILERIHTELDAGRIVYVHCWGGKGRTSTVIGCLLAESGLSYEAVIARIAELRVGTRKAGFPCPESTVQHDLLRERCAR